MTKTHTLTVLKDGDTTYGWEVDVLPRENETEIVIHDPKQVAEAQEQFEQLVKEGWSALEFEEKEGDGVFVDEFNPLAENTLMIFPMVGG